MFYKRIAFSSKVGFDPYTANRRVKGVGLRNKLGRKKREEKENCFEGEFKGKFIEDFEYRRDE